MKMVLLLKKLLNYYLKTFDSSIMIYYHLFEMEALSLF